MSANNDANLSNYRPETENGSAKPDRREFLRKAPDIVASVDGLDILGSPLFLVFLTSACLRIVVVAWFIPRSQEPHGRKRPKVLQLVLRVGRFNPISGVSLDWLTVVRKKGKGDGDS